MQAISSAARARAALPVAAALASLLAACGGGPLGADERPDDSFDDPRPEQAESVSPGACGDYASTDAGRRLHAFLEATVLLDEEVTQAEAELHATCQEMADELGIARPEGDTAEVCQEVIATLDDYLDQGLTARAELVVDYEPAVCEVDIDTAARAAAECEGSAEGEIAAQCHGQCDGICRGVCEGDCLAEADGAGADGECGGECVGTCRGTCEGDCSGYAEVDADASCEAHAEVRANNEARCTRPEVVVEYGGDIVDDAERLEAAARAIDVGFPGLLEIHARATGPVRAAFETWARTATELADAGMSVAREVGDQAVCVAGQISAAAAALASIEASLSVQVEVSASASATVNGGA